MYTGWIISQREEMMEQLTLLGLEDVVWEQLILPGYEEIMEGVNV